MIRAVTGSIIATAILSAFMYVNSQAGLLPWFDVLGQIAAFNERLGLPASEQAAWVTHLVVGVFINAVLYMLIEPVLPGIGAVKGFWFGLITFAAMVAVLMPLSGAGAFGQQLPPAYLVVALVMHVIYGMSLGSIYEALGPRTEPT